MDAKILRYRILDGVARETTEIGIQAISGYAVCEVVELNVQPGDVHLVVMLPSKLAISDLMDRVKGQTAIKLFKQFRHLRQNPYWGNNIWVKRILCG